jgi:hypothetical protein
MVRFTALVVLTVAAACVFSTSNTRTSATAFVPPTFVQRSYRYSGVDIARAASGRFDNRQLPQTKLKLKSAAKKEDESASAAAAADEGDDEFHQSDPAHTTTQFLSGLWHLIAHGNTLVRGVSQSDRQTE